MTGGELLAGARGADNHDPAVGRRDLLDRLAKLVDRRRTADHADRHRRERLELLDLALEPRGFQRAVGHQHQAVGLERLLDEIVGAALDRRDRGFDVAVAGDHHHRHFRVLLLDGVEQLQAVEPAALQPDVEEHEVRPARLDLVQARHRCRGRCGWRSPRPAGDPRPARRCRPRHQQSEYRTPYLSARFVSMLAEDFGLSGT